MRKRSCQLISLMLLAVFAILNLSGCSASSEKRKETSYMLFVTAQFNDLSKAVSGLKTQMSGFNTEKLSDQEWISQTNVYLDTISSDLDAIIQYEDVPENMQSVHQALVPLCETGKNLTNQMKNGIVNNDLGLITEVNNGLKSLADQFSTAIQGIKEKVQGEN